eukprot:5358907-Amphidinium_carterae.2
MTTIVRASVRMTSSGAGANGFSNIIAEQLSRLRIIYPFSPSIEITPSKELQSITDTDIKMRGFNHCAIMSGGVGLRGNFIMFHVVSSHCYAVVTPPPHNYFIMNCHSNSFVNKVEISKSQINVSLPEVMQQSYCMCGSDLTTHPEGEGRPST